MSQTHITFQWNTSLQKKEKCLYRINY